VEIEQLSSEDDVLKRLDANRHLTIPLMKELCLKLNLAVPTSRTRAAVQRHIAEGLVAHGRRSSRRRPGRQRALAIKE
jgi:hypothetical protein